MAAPIDADWANNNISDANLNATTHGSGTDATRTGLSSWPGDRPFFMHDGTTGTWYYNSHASAPSSITWTKIEGKTPIKRRSMFMATYDDDASSSVGTRLYFSPFGLSRANNTNAGLNDDTTASNVSIPVTAENITVRRVRVNVTNDGVTSGTYDVGLYNATDGAAVHSIDGNGEAGTHAKLDSGDISVSVDGGDELCWYYEPATGTIGSGVEIACLCEFEYDDVY